MKYRAKSGFALKDIAGEFILLPRGASTVDYNYVMVFNEAGALIYRAMENFTDTETLAEMLVDKYGIDRETADTDVGLYIEKMLKEGVVEAE